MPVDPVRNLQRQETILEQSSHRLPSDTHMKQASVTVLKREVSPIREAWVS